MFSFTLQLIFSQFSIKIYYPPETTPSAFHVLSHLSFAKAWWSRWYCRPHLIGEKPETQEEAVSTGTKVKTKTVKLESALSMPGHIAFLCSVHCFIVSGYSFKTHVPGNESFKSLAKCTIRVFQIFKELSCWWEIKLTLYDFGRKNQAPMAENTKSQISA